MLNNPGIGPGSQEFDVATKGEDNIRMDVERSMGIMSRTKPSGCTPLTEHIWDIHSTIDALKENLQAEGKRAVIVLATDGLPSNSLGESNEYIKEQFVQSLRALEGLPVWLVIRLSADEGSVVVSADLHLFFHHSVLFCLSRNQNLILHFAFCIFVLSFQRIFTTVLMINWNYQWMF